MLVNLDNNFENVKITFRGEEYILKDGQEFDNEDVIKAFPQYFKTPEQLIVELPETESDNYKKYIEDKKTKKAPLHYRVKVFFSEIFKSISKNVSENKTYIAMMVIAISAIFFDVNGWIHTFHQLSAFAVIFIVSGFYYAKYEIIDILTREEHYKDWFDKAKIYFVNFGLFLTLIGMVVASTVGIWDSLSGMTLGGVQEVVIIEKKVKKAKANIEDNIGAIKEMTETRNALSSRFPTAKYNLSLKITKYQERKQTLSDKLDKLLEQRITATSKLGSAHNTMIADAMNIPIDEYLIWKNVLWTFTLEFGYIFLTIRSTMLAHRRKKKNKITEELD